MCFYTVHCTSTVRPLCVHCVFYTVHCTRAYSGLYKTHSGHTVGCIKTRVSTISRFVIRYQLTLTPITARFGSAEENEFQSQDIVKTCVDCVQKHHGTDRVNSYRSIWIFRATCSFCSSQVCLVHAPRHIVHCTLYTVRFTMCNI